jgi:PEP-CTERM motif
MNDGANEKGLGPSKLGLKRLLLAASAIALSVAHAQATTFDLALTGVVADGTYASGNNILGHYDAWFLTVSGLDSTNAITVSQGDMIDAAVTLDTLFTIPASIERTVFSLILTGSSFDPAIYTNTSGTTSFFNGSSQVAGGPSIDNSDSGQLANSVIFFPPNNTAITFDSVASNFTITALSEQQSLDGAFIEYVLFSPTVPEPSTWAMMLAALGGLGLAASRRRARTSARHRTCSERGP